MVKQESTEEEFGSQDYNPMDTRSGVGFARVEQDDFVINDIALKIPPEQIVIDSNSFLNDWQTLRSSGSRISKSGYALTTVSFTAIFHDSDSINSRLMPLVAGLRATPFCVIHNKYLSEKLSSVTGGSRNIGAYKAFKPVVLVLSNMTFSTVPGMPGVIHGEFSFQLFNYSPYCPVWAYKTGPSLQEAGSVWNSVLWKKFYEPYLSKCSPLSWPHLDPTLESYHIRYRDFMLTENKKDSNVLKSARELASEAKGSTGTTPTSSPAQAVWDDLVGQGRMAPAIADSSSALEKGELDQYASAVYPSLQKLLPYIPQLKGNRSSIQSAVAELVNRYKREVQSKQAAVTLSVWEEIKELSKVVNYQTKSGNRIEAGSFQVFGKKKNIKFSVDNASYPSCILEGISISFVPSVAIIPLIGHVHPTCQCMGGYSVELSMTINATNSYATELYDTYYHWEDINLRFRQIPQGFRNLFIDCDFTRFFGITEYLAKNINSSTIPDQPGRTKIEISFVDAGIESTTKLDDPESLTQEFVASSSSLRKETWDILQKNFVETKEHRFEPKPGLMDQRKINFGGLVFQSAAIFDWLIIKTETVLFKGNSLASNEAGTIYKELMHVTQSGEFGYIPGLESLQRIIRQKLISSTKLPEAPKVSPLFTTYKPSVDWEKRIRESNTIDLQREQQALTRVPFPSKDEAVEVGMKRLGRFFGLSKDLSPEQEKEFKKTGKYLKLTEIGLFQYILQINQLLDEIINKFSIDVEEFKTIREAQKKQGIGQGKTAYPDFKSSIASVATFIDSSAGETSLLDYDPDVYLWSPTIDGSPSKDPTGWLIDKNLINKAQAHSQLIFDTAQKSVGDYFVDVYMEKVKKSDTKIFDSIKLKTLSPPMIQNESYVNTLTQFGSGGMKLSYKGEDSRIRTNSYSSGEPTLTATDQCQHSTDLGMLWGGVGTGGSLPQTSNFPKEHQPQEGYSEPGTITSASGGGSGKGVLALTFEWPQAHHWSSMTPVNGLVCPIEWYSGLTGNLLPRPLDFSMKDESWYKDRSKSANSDWILLQAKLVAQGYSDPKKFVNHPKIQGKPYFGKPIFKWTLREYQEGCRLTGLKLGYVHKGIDAGTSRQVKYKVYAIADGSIYGWCWPRVKSGAGIFLEIAHPTCPNGIGFSRYLHLQAIDPWLTTGGKLRKGTLVKAGQCIGIAGKSGSDTMGPHLHFEIWDKPHQFGNRTGVKLLSPQDLIPWTNSSVSNKSRSSGAKQRLSQLAQQTPNQPLSPGAESVSVIRSSIEAMEKRMLMGQGQRVVRAYPTFKLYFIQDDSKSRKRFGLDDFFSYNAVQSIKVVKSKKIPADLCVIELTNVNGILSNRKFKSETGVDKPRDAKGNIIDGNEAIDNPSKSGTSEENPVASMMLQEGINLLLKVGYSSDPDLLDDLFVGKIEAIEFSENDDLITIVAQSYATELVADIKGTDTPIEKKANSLATFLGFNNDASTGRIIEEMLASPEVVHFGRWNRGDTTANRELLTNKWQWTPNPADDNIFAPSPLKEYDAFSCAGWVIKEMAFSISKVHIWDVLKEMERRLPNFIGLPVPYHDKYGMRMTYFFGLPNQLYFARHPTFEEELVQTRLTQMLDRKVVREAANTRGDFLIRGLKNYFNKVEVAKELRTRRLQLAKEGSYIKPFRNYHFFTSSNHIVANNITAESRDIANTIIIRYNKGSNLGAAMAEGSFSKEANKKLEGEETYVLKLDNALPEEDIRAKVASFPNANGEGLCKRYAMSVLMDELRGIYRGSLIVLGEPSVKPTDICVLADSVSGMTGAIEVEQVIHTIDRDHGYLCDITPNMFVVAAEWSLLSTLEAIGVVCEGVNEYVYEKFGGNMVNRILTGISATTYEVGSFLAKKLIDYTPDSLPVIMVPLLVHGREFTGGVSTKKIPTSLWTTIFGEWKPEDDRSYSSWKEDLWDSVRKSINKMGGSYSTGSVFDGWSHNTVDED